MQDDVLDIVAKISKFYTALGPGELTAVVALITFVLARVIEIIVHAIQGRRARRRLVIGLYNEVFANMKSISKFLTENPVSDDMRSAVRKDRNLRPLMLVDESSQFYEANTAALPSISSRCLVLIWEFYAQLRRVNAIKQGFESNAFAVISNNGRAGTVDDLWEGARRAQKTAQDAIAALEKKYPKQWFADLKSLR